MRFVAAFLLVVGCLGGQVFGEEIKVVLWNCQALFNTQTVDKRASNGAATVLVAGDMNVGETDTDKNGYRLDADNMAPEEGDLYDDTHAIFSAGLIDGLHMASLTQALGSETYDDDRFAGSGPIDCMYVVGAQSGDFTLAKKSDETFGSDHFAVSTRFLFDGEPPAPEPGDEPGSATGAMRIVSLMPNPLGLDAGNEWLELLNDGDEAVNLNGWNLRDRGDNTAELSGEIEAGETVRITLASGQSPLNQSGDEIELLNPAGDVVHSADYGASQVVPGQAVLIEQ